MQKDRLDSLCQCFVVGLDYRFRDSFLGFELRRVRLLEKILGFGLDSSGHQKLTIILKLN